MIGFVLHARSTPAVALRATRLIVAAAALVAVTACGKTSGSGGSSGTSTETTTTEQPQSAGNATVDAREVFNSRCAACHGTEGRGNGPGAAALNPKPRNYHDKDWQAKVTDDQIKKTIEYGGAAVGKSPNMPANPDLEQKPEVVDGLVKIVRGFGQES